MVSFSKEANTTSAQDAMAFEQAVTLKVFGTCISKWRNWGDLGSSSLVLPVCNPMSHTNEFARIVAGVCT